MGRPAVPDLIGAANTQGALNKQTAFDVANANRYTQVGPEGSSNRWITDPATGAVTNQTTMGSRPEAYYNALMDTGTGAINSFANKYYGGGGAPGGGGGGGGGFAINIPNQQAGKIPGNIQNDLDYSKLTAMPGEDIGLARQQAQDALYGRAAGYLDPQWQQSEASTRTRLSNQGLVPGTAAYDRAFANEQRAKEQAYTGARQDAIAGGGAEAARAQEMALQLRNQGITEAGNLGTFHNAAQAQKAGQYLTDLGQQRQMSTTLGAAGISAGASMANAQLANALAQRQQEYTELTGMGKQAQDFLPQFGISQGNVQSYKPADVYGATQAQYEDELARAKAKKPGLLGQLLPIAGSIGGSFAGGYGGALGKRLGGG